jgi:formylglycine-generating enzyme required for sulfatase activity
LEPANRPKPGPTRRDNPTKPITNSIGMKLVLIPAGEFLMGSPDEDREARDDEKPQHRVRITRPFYLGTTEVTRGQFRRFVDETGYRTEADWNHPGFEQTDEHPVVKVNWNDAVAFAAWLSRKEGETYRLPTEAEWEYACRAGTTTRYSCGDDPEGLAAVGNLAAQDGYTYTAPVGRYKPNAWGLYDMDGNVWEWCSDGYAADYYKSSPVDDPPGSGGAPVRVIRGCGWDVVPGEARSANRDAHAPVIRRYHLGFRLARVQSVR